MKGTEGFARRGKFGAIPGLEKSADLNVRKISDLPVKRGYRLKMIDAKEAAQTVPDVWLWSASPRVPAGTVASRAASSDLR